MRECIVVGGGPAGLMAAIYAAQGGARVTLYEHKAPGTKLNITGKGRCNITNTAPMPEFLESIRTNPRFLYSALNKLSNSDLIAFLEGIGVPCKVERGGRVFPVSDKASDVSHALIREAKRLGINVVIAKVKRLIVQDGVCKGVYLYNDQPHYADAVVIATGGKSYPKTGSTGDGYRMAEQVGHTIVSPQPSLVPVEIAESFAPELMGLSLRNVRLTLTDRESKMLYSDFGEMLFTHFGVSGPIVLSASAHMSGKAPFHIAVDLKPALTHEQLHQRLLREFNNAPNKDIMNIAHNLYPKRLSPVMLRLCGIDEHIKAHSFTVEQRTRLVDITKSLPMTVTRLRPIDEAIVTQGGVSTREINPSDMQSRIVKGLYFAGEVIDVDAYTGGFNLQIAFSTGAAAGMSCVTATI